MSASIDEHTVEVEDDYSWPAANKYFIPQIMHNRTAWDLIRNDAYFEDLTTIPQLIQLLDLTTDSLELRDLDVRETDALEAREMAALPRGSQRIVFIDQRRRYSSQSTHINISISRGSWMKLLRQFDIPPTAVELLHENNGGSFQHVSYCHDNPQHPCLTPFARNERACAYHLCFKLCVWTLEHFIYWRYDFHSGTAFIMVAGTSNREQIRRLISQFRGQGSVEPFAVFHAIACAWAAEVESDRWKLDFSTLEFESLTGVSPLLFYGVDPLPKEKLRLRTDMAAMQDSLRCIHRASAHTGKLFEFLKGSLWRFREITRSPRHGSKEWDGEENEDLPPRYYHQQLSDALDQRISQQHSQTDQIGVLLSRVEMQWSVVNALLAHHSNDLNVDMARDARTESVLMRRIAFVTIVFLPATFMATFFSMGFFQVGDGDGGLHVSPWIWLYVACTAPLTVLMAARYLPAPMSPVSVWKNFEAWTRRHKVH